ncbi:MAG: UDP-N-acetylglucosamine pyrophosphorylase [Lachnospiraceae bacterium]
MESAKISFLFDLTQTIASPIFEGVTYPWEVLPKIKSYILELGAQLDPSVYEEKGENIWIAKTAIIYPNANIYGPCIIGEETEVRPGAFIRGNAIVGNHCVVGNSTELKNVILFNKVQVPHYNYVGDSILGYKSHMGAGSITSNVKSDKTLVVVKSKEYNENGEVVSTEEIPTGLKKFGAMLGDNVEVGCNSVLNPGTVVGRASNIYPTSCVRGVIPANSILKKDGKAYGKH